MVCTGSRQKSPLLVKPVTMSMNNVTKKFQISAYILIIILVPHLSICFGQDRSGLLPADKISIVNEIRFWSNPRYSRIAVDLNKETKFSYKLNERDCSNNSTNCIAIKIHNSKLSNGMDKNIDIHDEIISKVTLDQISSSSVELSINIKDFESCKIFSLSNPYRIVIDVWGKSHVNTSTLGELPNSFILKQNDTPSEVKLICIDAGFGGKDTGARCGDVYAKNINLQIARKISSKIENELGLHVVMTRKDDKYISLEERVAIANTAGADLLLSIHTNASKDSSASGIETFVLNLAIENDAIRIAASENQTSPKNIADMDSILTELMQNAKINESEFFARITQKKLFEHLHKRHRHIKNRGVKQAPFYILLGAEMPSIMVQTGFLTNPIECKLLSSDEYQEDISDGIVEGVSAFIKERQHTTKKFSGLKGRDAD